MSSLDLRNRYTYQDIIGIHNGDFVVNSQGQKIQITDIGYEVKRGNIILILTGTGPGVPAEHRVCINLNDIVMGDLQHKVKTQEKQIEMEFHDDPGNTITSLFSSWANIIDKLESEPVLEPKDTCELDKALSGFEKVLKNGKFGMNQVITEDEPEGEMIEDISEFINGAPGDMKFEVFFIDLSEALEEKPEEKKPEPIDIGKGIEDLLKGFGISWMGGEVSEGPSGISNGIPAKDKPFDLNARLKEIQKESRKVSPAEYSRESVKEGDLVAIFNPYYPVEDIEFHVVGEFRYDIENYISGIVPIKSMVDGKIYPIWIPIRCFSNCSHMKPSTRENNLVTRPGDSVLVGGKTVHTVAGFCRKSGSLLVWPSGWDMVKFIGHAPTNIYLQQVNSGHWKPFNSSGN